MEKWWDHKRQEYGLFIQSDQHYSSSAGDLRRTTSSLVRCEQHVDMAIQHFIQKTNVLVAAHNDLREAILSCDASSYRLPHRNTAENDMQERQNRFANVAAAACRNIALLLLRVPLSTPLDIVRDAVENRGVKVSTIWRAEATGTVYITHHPGNRPEVMRLAAEGDLPLFVPSLEGRSPSRSGRERDQQTPGSGTSRVYGSLHPDRQYQGGRHVAGDAEQYHSKTDTQTVTCEVVAPYHSIIDDLSRVRDFEITQWWVARDALIANISPYANSSGFETSGRHGVRLEQDAQTMNRLKLLDDRCELLRKFFSDLRRAVALQQSQESEMDSQRRTATPRGRKSPKPHSSSTHRPHHTEERISELLDALEAARRTGDTETAMMVLDQLEAVREEVIREVEDIKGGDGSLSDLVLEHSHYGSGGSSVDPEVEVSPLLFRTVRQHYRLMLQIVHFYRDVLPSPFVGAVASACQKTPPRQLTQFLEAQRKAGSTTDTSMMSPSQLLLAIRTGSLDRVEESFGTRHRLRPHTIKSTSALFLCDEEQIALEVLRRDATHILPFLPSPRSEEAWTAAGGQGDEDPDPDTPFPMGTVSDRFASL